MPLGSFVALNERTHASQVPSGVCVRCSNYGTHTEPTASHTHASHTLKLSCSSLGRASRDRTPARAERSAMQHSLLPGNATPRQSSATSEQRRVAARLGGVLSKNPSTRIQHVSCVALHSFCLPEDPIDPHLPLRELPRSQTCYPSGRGESTREDGALREYTLKSVFV